MAFIYDMKRVAEEFALLMIEEVEGGDEYLDG
jgi:hypothetical protein